MQSSPSPTSTLQRRTRALRDVLFIAGAVIVAGILLRVFVIGAARISGSSMEHTLLPGDFVLISKIARTLPGFPSVGDVVAVRLDRLPDPVDIGSSEGVVVKRCVAGPGDTLMIRGSSVWVNGMNLRFPLTARKRADLNEEGVVLSGDVGPIVVPAAGSGIMLTPANVHFWKSLVEREGHRVQITGGGGVTVDDRIVTEYRVAHDYCFLLGDNLKASVDSRIWGFVPLSSLEGKVILVYWSVDSRGETSSIRWDRFGKRVQ